MPKNILKCIHFFQQRLGFCGLATLKIIAFASDFYKSLQRPFLKVRLKKWFALDWNYSHIGFFYLARSSIQTSMLQIEDTKQTDKRAMAFWRPCNQCGHSLEQSQGLSIPSSWKLEGGWDWAASCFCSLVVDVRDGIERLWNYTLCVCNGGYTPIWVTYTMWV